MLRDFAFNTGHCFTFEPPRDLPRGGMRRIAETPAGRLRLGIAHMHDLHATLLYSLGLDHERLTYRHAGRDFRLTDVYGSVVHDILS